MLPALARRSWISLLLTSWALSGCPASEPPCAPGELLDSAALCVPLTCGPGPFRPDATLAALFVSMDGDDGAAGTPEAPMRSVARAFERAGPGGALEIGAGSFSGTLAWDREEDAPSVRGRCAELTHLRAGDPDRPVATLGDGAITLSNLSLGGSDLGGLAVERSGVTASPRATVHDLVIDDVGGVGVTILGATASLVAQRLTVRNGREDADGIRGAGIRLEAGTLQAEDLRIERVGETGLLAYGGSLEMNGARIREVGVRADGLRGRGVSLREGVQATLRDLDIAGVSEAGVVVSSGAEALIEGVIVRDSRGVTSGDAGFGLAVITAGGLVARDVDIEGTVAAALAAQGSGSRLEVEGGVVRGTRGGVSANDQAEVHLASLEFDDVERWGISAFSSVVTARDVLITGTRVGQGDVSATGVGLTESTLDADGLVLSDTARVGLLAQSGSIATLRDCVIRGSVSDELDDRPVGLRVTDGSSVHATRLLIEGGQASGLEAADSDLILIDSQITGVLPFGDGLLARAMTVMAGTTLYGERLEVQGATEIAVLIDGADTSLTLVDSVITGTAPSPFGSAGGALAVQSGAVANLQGGRIEGNGGAGIYVALGEVVAEGLSLRDNGFAGAVCVGGQLTLLDGSVEGTRLDPAHGGGVGVFAHRLVGRCDVQILGTRFEDLPGPALYARGPGGFLLREVTVLDAGGPPSFAGGVVAIDGVLAPSGDDDGLVIEGSHFAGLGADAILLDRSGALLQATADGTPNTFDALAGEPLFVQRCGPVAQVLDGSADPSCRVAPRPMGPPLEYLIQLLEVTPEG